MMNKISDIMIMIMITLFSVFSIVIIFVAIKYYQNGKRKANFCDKYNKPLNLLDYEKIKFLDDAVKSFDKCINMLIILVISLVVILVLFTNMMFIL